MDLELTKTFEKLEQIESSAMEDTKELSPLESVENNELQPELLSEYNISFEGRCRCSGDCGGSTFSRNGECRCSGNCGSGTASRG